MLVLALAFLVGGAQQVLREASVEVERDVAAVSVIFTGRVLTPELRPAGGAVVTTSAGGRARVAADGSFALVVEVPLAAASVELTATLDRATVAGGLVATTAFVPGSLAPQTLVGTLVLSKTEGGLPRWRREFGALPGVDADQYASFDDLGNGRVNACTVFDDGSGPALYVGGYFDNAGGVTAHHVVRWDGEGWSAVGDGMAGAAPNVVFALVVFDDGSGPALYAGGNFATAGGIAASNVARWDGSTWSPLAAGLNGTVRALAVHDDGSGAALYAGGDFLGSGPGSLTTFNVARWNGSSWSALGSGTNVGGGIHALAVFDDGTGPALYAGGNFTTAGGSPASHIARWDGSSWAALGTGVNLIVRSLAVFDDGTGAALYAAGNFTTAGGVPASHVARWDGASWSALASGACCSNVPAVRALATFDDGSGPALYAGGSFSTAGGSSVNNVARWDGTTWSSLATGITDGPNFHFPVVSALGVFADRQGPALFVGGDFSAAGDVGVKRIARWDGASWSGLGRGLANRVAALELFDDGSGPALYAGGNFAGAGGVPGADRIARWDGASWAALGSGVAGSGSVEALEVFDDGGGSALYAGGVFTSVGGIPAANIARWDGTSWSALGSGIEAFSFGPQVLELTVFDDGSGSALYVGGDFERAGGVPASRIARWNGTSWSAVGGGFFNGWFEALVGFDDGSGPALYAGGLFSIAGGVPASKIARWDGTSWSALDAGVNGWVHALAVFDDGSGPALYVGGRFSTAGGLPAACIARWDGVSWSAVGSGLGGTSNLAVTALCVFDDGTGRALFATGNFLTAGSIAASRIARWNGTRWKGLPGGLGDWGYALAEFDDAGRPALGVGGSFDSSPEGDAYLAKWVRGLRSVSR